MHDVGIVKETGLKPSDADGFPSNPTNSNHSQHVLKTARAVRSRSEHITTRRRQTCEETPNESTYRGCLRHGSHVGLRRPRTVEDRSHYIAAGAVCFYRQTARSGRTFVHADAWR